jgi:hypothetical protein
VRQPRDGMIDHPAFLAADFSILKGAVSATGGTRHDSATPYEWALRLTDDLGNARLITIDGDGHPVCPQEPPL